MAGLSWLFIAQTAPVADGEITWHQEMVVWAQQISIVMIVAAMVACIYRLLRGPHLVDRALAVDTISVQLVGLVTLLTMRLGTLVYFDGILVLSLLGFAGTVAMAQYIGRPHLKSNAGSGQSDLSGKPAGPGHPG